MTNNLSPNETVAVEQLPATTVQLASELNVSHSYIYDIVESLRKKGYGVEQDSEGQYYISDEPDTTTASAVEVQRKSSSTKATITRNAKETLAEMERELKETLQETDPQIAEGGHTYSENGTDVIFHRTDDHFGEVVSNQYGEETFNTEIAAARVRQYFDEALAKVENRRAAGEDIENGHLLLGGDMVTNEAIYEGQAHEIDASLYTQINRAADVYIEQIKRLSEYFDSVKVACQSGNHGRINGAGATNADDILYSIMDRVIRESDVDNVTFMQSDTTYYVDFSIRDWNVHLRHGHDKSLEHIGTSAGKQRWLSWLVDHNFDVAFRGHYHVYKEEPINGRPVHMGGSLVPQTEFEESMALSGRPVGAIHGATDRAPTEWTEKIYF